MTGAHVKVLNQPTASAASSRGDFSSDVQTD